MDYLIVDYTLRQFLADQPVEPTNDNPIPELAWYPLKTNIGYSCRYTDEELAIKACNLIRSTHPGHEIEVVNRYEVYKPRRITSAAASGTDGVEAGPDYEAALRAGQEARRLGFPVTDNPHPVSSIEHLGWLNGWNTSGS